MEPEINHGHDVLTERVHNIEFTSDTGTWSVRLYFNPTAQSLLHMVDHSKQHGLRGLLIDPATAVFWDAYSVHHSMVAHWLRDQGYDIPSQWAYRAIVVDARQKPPVLFLDDDYIDAPVIRRLASNFRLNVTSKER